MIAAAKTTARPIGALHFDLSGLSAKLAREFGQFNQSPPDPNLIFINDRRLVCDGVNSNLANVLARNLPSYAQPMRLVTTIGQNTRW